MLEYEDAQQQMLQPYRQDVIRLMYRVCCPQMEDLGSGEYAGGFSAMAAGAYSISVTFQGAHIGGSPFAAEASASGMHDGWF